MLSKSTLLQEVIDALEKDFDSLSRSAVDTHSASTGDEAKQEGKYDTRSLENSYLAEAQAAKLDTLRHQIGLLGSLTLPDEDETAVLGSLITLTPEDDEDLLFFLLPAGGGCQLTQEGTNITVISPSSAIGAQVINRPIGTFLEVNAQEYYLSEIE